MHQAHGFSASVIMPFRNVKIVLGPPLLALDRQNGKAKAVPIHELWKTR
jgi:hypothetical protein